MGGQEQQLSTDPHTNYELTARRRPPVYELYAGLTVNWARTLDEFRASGHTGPSRASGRESSWSHSNGVWWAVQDSNL
jgi:hypothetical protein